MPSQAVKQIRKQLTELSDATIAEHSLRFFKTGPGQYGEGDRFIGIRVPVLRKVAREHRLLDLKDVKSVLQSPIHEERLLALLVLVLQFEKGDAATRKAVYDFYIEHLTHVNNWDLVDSSAHQIVGGHLRDRSRRPLYRWAKSNDLWERRVSIIATYAFIKDNDFDDTLAIAELLLHDDHDLIHKAVGWMLREVGNRDRAVEESFLKEHYHGMPRTMLRYAIERFPERRRKAYLNGTV